MEAQQRFLRRKFLIDKMEVYLRESDYHRTHEEAEQLQGIKVWSHSEKEGQADGLF